jgi:hypothetical protein
MRTPRKHLLLKNSHQHKGFSPRHLLSKQINRTTMRGTPGKCSQMI